jgi:hypothetical protein
VLAGAVTASQEPCLKTDFRSPSRTAVKEELCPSKAKAPGYCLSIRRASFEYAHLIVWFDTGFRY